MVTCSGTGPILRIVHRWEQRTMAEEVLINGV